MIDSKNTEPWYYNNSYTKDDVKEILFDLVEKLNKISRKNDLSLKSKQSYREWLRPFILKWVNSSHGLRKREFAEVYIDSLKLNNRDLTYVVNVRLLLQKLFDFSPPLSRILIGELSDEKRTNQELVLTEKSVRAIKGWAEEHDSTGSPDAFDELADYITLILMTGIRPFEARNLNIAQLIDLRDKSSTKIIGKGKKGRDIVCPRTSCSYKFLSSLIHRLRLSIKEDKLPIFQKSDRFYRREFLKLQKDILLIKSSKYCSLHSLRRAAARSLFSSVQDIFVVKNFLGHKKTITTERYLNLAVNDLIQKVTDSQTTNDINYISGK